MQDIRTFVYFDLEATGLKSSGRPRVCEISLIAVNTSDIQDLHEPLLNKISDKTHEDTIIIEGGGNSSKSESSSPHSARGSQGI